MLQGSVTEQRGWGEKDWRSSLDLGELCQSGVVTPCDGVSEGGCDGHTAIRHLSLLSSKTRSGASLKLVLQRFVYWNAIALFPFPPPHKLSTEVFQLWSIGYQGKDRFSLQKTVQFLVFLCSMFEQQTVKLRLPTCWIFYEHSGHFEFNKREKTTCRLFLYFQYILIFSVFLGLP